MKTSYQTAAEAMLAEGATRVEAGDVVTLRPGYTVKVLTGWGAHDAKHGRLVCVGKVDVNWRGRKDDPTGDAAELAQIAMQPPAAS